MVEAPVRENSGPLDLLEVFEAYRPSLRAFLWKRLRNDEDVSDAMQETSLRLLTFQMRAIADAPGALIFHIAECVAMDFSRRAKVRCSSAHRPLDDLELLSPGPSPEQVVLAGQELEQLISALERLSPKCQEVFLLSRMENLSYPQIANRFGISVKMVEKYMSRALAELRSQLDYPKGATT